MRLFVSYLFSSGTREIARLDQSHIGWVLKIAKVPLQISFKHSEPFFGISNQKLFPLFVLKGNLIQKNLRTFQENKDKN